MITRVTFKFLKDLASHNRRDWFKGHRKEYEAARQEFLGQVDVLLLDLAGFNPAFGELEPKDCLFRINRDTRFSRSKEPYKTNLGAFMTEQGRKVARAGYYLHVEPGKCFLAGGLYMPPAAELRLVRRAIDERGDELKKLIRRKSFKDAFGDELPGDRLKTAPRDYPATHPHIDLLRLKSYEIAMPISDKDIMAKGFDKQAHKTFKFMRDYVEWINGALG